ncbi:MAG: Glyoxylate reductase [Micrococcaceae bacterium]|nr:Glyoxylate reductase [Micrococcaceae bacterium]
MAHDAGIPLDAGEARRPLIVATRALPDSTRTALTAVGELRVEEKGRPLTPEELRSAVAGADALVTYLHDRIDSSILDAAGPQLRCVANVAAGYDNVDVDALAHRGVILSNTPGVLTEATADLALAMILALTRRIGEGERLIRAGRPWRWEPGFLLGSGLAGKTLGIIGMGGIGAATARRARAFGMQIRYTGRSPISPELAAELNTGNKLELDELLAGADVVSIHCPLTPATRHLLNRERLAGMRPSAYLINTSRGAVVDEAALVDALAAGSIAGAALDVYEHEPAVHPGLLELENVVLLPHLGSATIETRTAMADLAASNVVAVMSGSPAVTPVPLPGTSGRGSSGAPDSPTGLAR